MVSPHVAQFLGAQAVGQAADAMTALVVADAVLGGSAGAVDPSRLLATLGAAVVPYLVASPLGGVVADRWDRRRMLFVVNLARAAVTVLALLGVATGSRLAGLAAVVCLLAAGRFVYNLRAAALPNILMAATRRARLVALDAAALRVGVVALAVGGALAALAGGRAPVTVLALASVLQVVSAVGFLTLQLDLGGRAAASARAAGLTFGQVAARCGALLASAPSRTAIVVTSTHRVLLGASFATFVLVAANEYGLGARGYVVAMGVTGTGSMLGTLTAPRWSTTLGAPRLVRVAFAAPAVLLGVTALAKSEAYLIVALATAFFLFQNVRVVTDALIQEAIPDDARARVFCVYDALYNLSYFLGGAVAIGASGDHARPGVLAWVGLAYVVLTAAFSAPGALRPLACNRPPELPAPSRPRLVRSTP